MEQLPVKEATMIEDGASKIHSYSAINKKHNEYYEGKNQLDNLKIAIPLEFGTAPATIRWGGIYVDSFNARLNLEGFTAPESYTASVQEIYDGNNLSYRSRQGILDSLIYGCSYAVIGYGDPSYGEPKIKITFHSPHNIVGKRNNITGRLEHVIQVKWDELGQVESGVIYTEKENIYFVNKGGYKEVHRDVHNLGRVPVVQLATNPRTGKLNGQALINTPMRNLLDEAVRTYWAVAVMREFFAFPGRIIAGPNDEDFINSDGEQLENALSLYTKFIHLLSLNSEGQSPTFHQWQTASPDGLLGIVKALKEEFAAMASLPIGYFGTQTQNPPSGDAIRAMESQAIKIAEDLIDCFSEGFKEIMIISLLMKDGISDDLYKIKPLWRDPATPTKATNGDYVVKMVGAGILDPQAESTWNEAGISESTKSMMREERSTNKNIVGEIISPDAAEANI